MQRPKEKRILGVGERLASAITNSGMSLQELSRKTDVDASHISDVMNGNSIMREFDIARLCTALNISADWLLGITTTDANKCVEVDRNFETMLICAERYACGRQTYMPSLVIDYITPLLPRLSDSTPAVLERDIAGANGYGDEKIDKPCWMRFLSDVRAELERRKQ